jgi:hypothetical protein
MPALTPIPPNADRQKTTQPSPFVIEQMGGQEQPIGNRPTFCRSIAHFERLKAAARQDERADLSKHDFQDQQIR